MRWRLAAGAVALVTMAAPAHADLRDDLAKIAFVTTDKKTAVAEVNAAVKQADAAVAADPADRDAQIQRGIAIGYRAKLTNNAGDAKAVKKIFEQLVAGNPRDAEATLALATWHLDAYDQLGTLVARTVLGARRADGEALLDKAIAQANGRAFILGYAALLTIRLDPKAMAKTRQLVEAAAKGSGTTGIDRLMRRDAGLLLPILTAGNGKAAADLARKMMPFGRMG